jgi:hypothetical protein
MFKTSFTNSLGKFNFTDVAIDTTAWDVRIAVKGDTMGVGANCFNRRCTKS